MKINICNDNKEYPFLYIDDFYTQEEEELIWKELDFYTHPEIMHRSPLNRVDAEEAHGIRFDPLTGKNVPGKNSWGDAWRVYIDKSYAHSTNRLMKTLSPIHIQTLQEPAVREISHILRLQRRKMTSEPVINAIRETGPYYKFWNPEMPPPHCQLNYYEDGDNYGSHPDTFYITTACTFYRKPKAFTGGDHFQEDGRFFIEATHNRMVIHPSYYLHEIRALKMNDESKGELSGLGRYAMISFYPYNYMHY